MSPRPTVRNTKSPVGPTTSPTSRNSISSSRTDNTFVKPITPPPTRNSSQSQLSDTTEYSKKLGGTPCEKRPRGRPPLIKPSNDGVTRTSDRQTATTKAGAPTRSTAGEMIETHFAFNNSLYFIVYNEALGEANFLTRQFLAPVVYTVKPLWYMAGTPALQRYFRYKMKDSDKSLIPEKDTLGINSYAARKLRKLVADFYRCVIEAAPRDPKTSTERYEYSLNIPSDWGQLAHYRLKYFNIDRVMSCAWMPTSEDDSTPPVNVYVVRWQNETMNELMPTNYLQNFHAHQHHHEVVLDYWEEAGVQDTRMFRSAASVDFARQETTTKTNSYDDYFVNCVHQFRARSTWTDENGGWSKKLCTQYVYKWVGWPTSVSWVSSDLMEGANYDKVGIDDEDDDKDPQGFDEYVQLLVHDKFPHRYREPDDDQPKKNVEELSATKLDKHCAPVSYTAHFPSNWRKLGEEHAAENDEVEVLAVVKQFSQANVYLVKWPSYDHPTVVSSSSMRKRHCRQLLAFFEKTAYLPRIQILKPEPILKQSPGKTSKA